jgi:hypothetical protein
MLPLLSTISVSRVCARPLATASADRTAVAWSIRATFPGGNETGSAARRIDAVDGVGAGKLRDDGAVGGEASVGVERRDGADTGATDFDATVAREEETAATR